MAVTFGQLEAFYWVARLGTFRAAAHQLGRAQPSISERVLELELALGVSILKRGKGKLTVTEEGMRIFDYVERMLYLRDEMIQGTREDRVAPQRIRIGAIDTCAELALPSLLRVAKEAFPGALIDITIDNSVRLRQMLNEQQLDISFLIDPDSRPFFGREQLFEIEQVWVAGPSADLSIPATPTSLARVPIFAQLRASFATDTMLDWFATAGVEPSSLNTCNEIPMILKIVEAGMGISLLPLPMVSANLVRGLLSVIPFTPAIAPRSLYASYDLRLRAGMSKLVESVRTAMQAHREQVPALSSLLMT